jgi:hypothetical protein
MPLCNTTGFLSCWDIPRKNENKHKKISDSQKPENALVLSRF